MVEAWPKRLVASEAEEVARLIVRGEAARLEAGYSTGSSSSSGSDESTREPFLGTGASSSSISMASDALFPVRPGEKTRGPRLD
jgi:hypothetical protein